MRGRTKESKARAGAAEACGDDRGFPARRVAEELEAALVGADHARDDAAAVEADAHAQLHARALPGELGALHQALLVGSWEEGRGARPAGGEPGVRGCVRGLSASARSTQCG